MMIFIEYLVKEGASTFREVEPIAESDDADTARFQHPVNFCKHLLRLLHVLNTDTAQHCIVGALSCRPIPRIVVQIPHKEAIQLPVAAQLQAGIHFLPGLKSLHNA